MRNWGLILLLAGCVEAPPCNLVGVWQTDRGVDISFQPNGTWQAGSVGGSWKQQGNTVTLTDQTSVCANRPGSYTTGFGNNCGKVTLTVQSDPCADRAAAIDGLNGYRVSASVALPDLAERVSLPDLSVKRTDLAKPLDGCNGLLSCYIDCNMNNPVQSCFDDCDAGATQRAMDLMNAFGNCIDTNCYQTTNPATGTPYCTDATINDAPCDECYNRILGTNGVCRPAQTACTNDKP